MQSTIGVVIGVIVLLICIGFVVLMMVTEWSRSEDPAPKGAGVAGSSARPGTSPRRRSAVGAKKAAPKKQSAKKSKKK